MFGETFQVAAMIEKLFRAWKDFNNYFKHKRKKMSIEYLIIRLHIKKDNRDSEKKGTHYPNEAKVVSSSRKPTTKGRAVSWDLKGESPRS